MFKYVRKTIKIDIMNRPRLLLIGGNGVIGTELSILLHNDYDITVLDINPYKVKFDNVNYVSGFLEQLDWFSVSSPFEYIINLASVSRPVWAQREPQKTIEYNTLGCVKSLELARKHDAKLVYTSSREVYGDIKESELPAIEESQKRPINIYGTAKLAAEMICKTYSRNYGLNVNIARFCGVYGSKYDLPTRVIPLFINLAINNKPITVEGGKQKLAFVYISDTCEGVKKILEYKGRGFDDFNLASDEMISIEDLAKLIVRLSNSNSEMQYIPPRTYDVENFWGSYEKAKKKLGWAQTVGLRDGIEKTINLYNQKQY